MIEEEIPLNLRPSVWHSKTLWTLGPFRLGRFDARSVLISPAQAAWVFGGMGSWNDQGFDGQTQDRYERLSENLYKLLNRVIVTAANSEMRQQMR
jgi:hypothetical protein